MSGHNELIVFCSVETRFEVSLLRPILSGELAALKRLLIAGCVATVLGIVIIATGVIADWGQTRLFGALLISIGGTLAGVAVGFSEPWRQRIWSRLVAWRGRIAVIVAIVVAAPAAVATVVGAAGPLVGGGDANNGLLVALGALIGLALAGATAFAAIVAVQATLRRGTTNDLAEPNGETGEERA